VSLRINLRESCLRTICAAARKISRARSSWRYVEARLAEAANGGDIAGTAIALRMVLMLEGVECRPQ
jgi:hypothetical protein